MFVLAAPNIEVNGIPFQEAFHNDGQIQFRVTFQGLFGPKLSFFFSCILTPSVFQYHFSSRIRLLEFEPLDESLNRKVQMQQLKVEEMTLKVAERRKRVPEQVKMLLDDAIRRQSAMADRVEFEDEENQAEEDANMWEGMGTVFTSPQNQSYNECKVENVYTQHGSLFYAGY